MENTTTITFANPSVSGSLDSLWIEAKGWTVEENKVSFADLYQTISSQVLSTFTFSSPYDLAYIQPPSHDCGIVDGQITNTIYVYRSNNSLSYSLHHSYGSLGSLGSRNSEEISFSEIFNFNIEKTATLSYPLTGNVSISWQGVVYDANGSVTSHPSYVIQDNSIILSKKVYGSLKVTYTLVRDVYSLSLSPGEDSDLFGGAIYAVYAGGISWLELSSPPEITPELLNGDVDCGWQWGNLEYDFSGLEDPESNIPKNAPKVDTDIEIDYCTQVVTSVSKNYV